METEQVIKNASDAFLRENAANGLKRGLDVLSNLGEQPLRGFVLLVWPDDGSVDMRCAFGGEVLAMVADFHEHLIDLIPSDPI